MNIFKGNKRISPWAWIPTLYFSEGLPNVVVITLAAIMYQRLGLSNAEITLYTGWLHLPWVIKPLWSPFVDLIKTKRAWVIAMQILIGAAFAGVAFFIPTAFFIKATLAFFWLLAFSSATHDIAADGFYMLGLSTGQQSFFVGIRNTFYRLANIFTQGVLVVFAGLMETGVIFPSLQGNHPMVWSIVFFLLVALFIGLTLYHSFILPKPESDKQQAFQAQTLFKNSLQTFISFFKKKHLGLIFFFLLTYRLGEAQLGKLASLFLLGSADTGGMEMETATFGMVYGTIGLIALTVGGILGGILISRDGFGKWIVPMALAINLPDLLYVYLASALPDNLWIIIASLACEQFGYGFGFTAYTLFLIYIADGEHKTAHYAIGTGFMALGLMLPGMVAGWIQEQLGYTNFFIWVCICTIPGIIASIMVKRRIEPGFGTRNNN